MTLLQIIKRIQTIAEAHKQIRRFKTGLAGDLFDDHTAKYPACCLQYGTGLIGTTGINATTVNFRMFLVDLVHVSEDTKDNQDDVLSDTLSIIEDLVAEISQPAFNDWILSSSNNLQSLLEGAGEPGGGDMYAGWYMDFSIRKIFTQNICAVPSDLFVIPGSSSDAPGINGVDMNVYDTEYIATGSEGTTFSPPAAVGKKILFVTRENQPIYKVSSAPDSTEYTWDNTNIGTGAGLNAGDRFLIIYRNY